MPNCFPEGLNFVILLFILMNNQEGQSKRIGEYLIGIENCIKRRPSGRGHLEK